MFGASSWLSNLLSEFSGSKSPWKNITGDWSSLELITFRSTTNGYALWLPSLKLGVTEAMLLKLFDDSNYQTDIN
jgi:hypothetical protein